MPEIVTNLWFEDQALEAARFYTSVFPNSRITDQSPVTVGFELDGRPFRAIDGRRGPGFNESVSLAVDCADQDEVDRYWVALTAGGGAESMCGWLVDPFGVSWQVIPRGLGELLGDPDPERASRAMEAMLQMRKLDIGAIRKAADGS